MNSRTRNTLPSIHTEGGLLPADLLQRILNRDKSLTGLDVESYHLPQNEKLNEAISRSWTRLQGDWSVFTSQREKLSKEDTGTSITRERWLLPLFQELGYGRLTSARAMEIQGKSFPISHIWGTVPLHLVGCNLSLNTRTPGAAGAARISPHSLLQEYLNINDEVQWGVVTNGLKLRVLRDFASLTRQAYVEFDLEAMFTGEAYSDFVLLWMVCHQSRFEIRKELENTCLLEAWSKTSREQGTRALDTLRGGVEDAIRTLGSGFLKHSANTSLKEKLRSGKLDKQEYFWQVLRLVYRMIFLFVTEDRDLLMLPLEKTSTNARERYVRYFSTQRLREIVELNRGSRHSDRYELLAKVTQVLGSTEGCPQLALPALGGWLFSVQAALDLEDCRLENRALFAAVYSLAYMKEDGLLRAVDYRNLGPEELGSVYESLLELHPDVNTETGEFSLFSAAGNERKTTGSYYTPTSLITELLNSALDPVIEQALIDKADKESREAALLDLKVCDPACGSGHFLVNAAHRLARRLAQVRSDGEEPAPDAVRGALRDIVRHCIYGVDINPMAVELCKVNLWLDSIEPGKPLSFLDAHIKCGNSLVGIGLKMHIDKLMVPSEAFNPVTGDDKPTALLLKKRNKEELAGKESLFVTVLNSQEDLRDWLAGRVKVLNQMREESVADVQAKQDAFRAMTCSDEYIKQKQVADLWTAAFFWQIGKPTSGGITITIPTHGQLQRLRDGNATQVGLMETVEKIAAGQGFFHYPLEFPEVEISGGFDCILGNPPWERIKLQEEEFFASRDLNIAFAINKASRSSLINSLESSNPLLAREFSIAKHYADATLKFMRESSRFPLTGAGDVNTYALFSENNRNLLNRKGYCGLVLPSGIATDEMTKDFYSRVVIDNEIVSLYDFENRENLFPSVDSRIKFTLLTISKVEHLKAEYVFFASRPQQLSDIRRRFYLNRDDIALFNPNSFTTPIFRTNCDADIARQIYCKVPILEDEKSNSNTWQIKLLRMLDMGGASHLFTNQPSENTYQLYESKMIAAYDHRFANVVTNPENKFRPGQPQETSIENHLDPNFKPKSQWYIPKQNVHSLFSGTLPKWFICFKRIVGVTNERTLSATIIPISGVSDSLVEILSNESSIRQSCLLANLNSLVLDFITRLKVSATTINHFVLKQFPILPPDIYSQENISFIIPRVLELVFTSYDLQTFASDLGYAGDPYTWDAFRRAILRAELDAYFARMYGLNHKQLRYILDPADLTERELEDILDPWEEVSGALDPAGYATRTAASDFPGETFRVLKEKENRLYGEYRTRRLVLEAWERIKDLEIGNPEGYVRPAGESVPVQVKESAPTYDVMTSNPGQPTLTDFTMYKCSVCGRHVMAFDRENHVNEKHGGSQVEWRKMG
jgi:hypothetical protein